MEERRTNARTIQIIRRHDDLRFNPILQVDTMVLHSRPVLHMVDTATHFSSAPFLRSKSSRDISKTSLLNRMHICVGPLGYLAVDQGSGFTSTEMREYIEPNV